MEVLQHVTGHGTQGVKAKLSTIQQRVLVARVKLGDFATVWDVIDWVEAREMAKLGMKRIFLPSYSTELNPTERIFEEVQQPIEGYVYPSLGARQYRIDRFLRQLRADKERLRSLVSWDWIENVFHQLPLPIT